MIAGVVAGTDTAKGQFHGSDIILKSTRISAKVQDLMTFCLDTCLVE
jgi:hypothetical protein